jgi:PAS domain S-box-containing protein
MELAFSFRHWIKRNSPGILVFLIASLAGLTLFSLSNLISSRVEDEVVENFVIEGLGIIENTSHQVKYLLVGIGNELQQLSQLGEIKTPDVIRESEIFEITFQSMANYISCLRRLDGEGNLIFGYHSDCEPIRNAPTEGDWDYFQKMLSEKELVMSELFKNDAGQRRVRLAYPILLEKEGEGGLFDGVVAAGVKIDNIKYLTTSPFDDNDRMWMRIIWLGSEGRVISFPDHPDMDGESILDGRMPCGECHTFSGEFLNTRRRGQGWDVIHNFDGKKMIALYSPVKLADQVWIAGLYADYDYILGEAGEIGKYANLVSALSLLIILLGSVVSLSLIKVRRESDRKEKEIEHERDLLRKVKESEEKFKNFFDGASVAIFVEDLDGNILDINRKAIDLFGFKKKEFLHLNITDMLHAEDLRKFSKMREMLVERGEGKEEVRMKRKDGSFFDVDVLSRLVAIGKENLVQTFVRDISEVKQKEKEIRDKNEELNTLNEVSKVIGRSLVLDEILDLSLRKILEITAFDTGAIYLYDERTQILNLKVVIGLPPEINKEITSIPMGQALTGEIARERKMILLDSLSEDPRSLTTKAGVDLNSYVGLPILYGKRLMGVINLASHTRLPREDFKVDLLRGVSELIGIAMSNAHLYGSTQQIAKEMKVLYESGKSFMTVTEEEQLARMVVDVASSELGYNACTLFTLDEESRELSTLSTSCPNKKELGKENIDINSDGVIAWVAANKELCHLPDVSKDARYQPGWLEKGAELAIPLQVGEKILGVIDFEREEVNSFSPEGIRYLSLFANQVAWALDNVHHFEEIKKANEDLNRVSELKTQFVSLVSHELRTPMTAIKGSLDIIHSGASGPVHEKQKMFISMARRNIDRLSDLINNILDLSRIEAGKIEFDFNEINIQDPLNHVLLTLAGSADEKKITLESQIPTDLPTIYADGAKVEQIFTNLVANALKYTPAGGKVVILARKAGLKDVKRLVTGKDKPAKYDHFVKISVLDTGTGIPQDQLEAIFDRYIQLKGKKGERGTGLGLAICRHLVEEHGGAIWAERGAEQGSVLNFLLPVFSEGAHGCDQELSTEDHREKID